MAAPRKPPCGGRAEVRSGGDLVKGQFIEYDGMTENYLVTNGSAPGSAGTESLVTGQGGHSAQRQQRPRECRAAALDHEIIYSALHAAGLFVHGGGVSRAAAYAFLHHTPQRRTHGIRQYRC